MNLFKTDGATFKTDGVTVTDGHGFMGIFSTVNYLNDVIAENKKLKEILIDFRDTTYCKQTWVEEMHSTIVDVLGKCEK